MALWYERRVDTDLDRAVSICPDRRDQFDAVTKTVGEPHVSRRDSLDPLDVDVTSTYPEPIGERCKDDCFMRSVPAIHVQGRIGLGVSRILRFTKQVGKLESGFRHPR